MTAPLTPPALQPHEEAILAWLEDVLPDGFVVLKANQRAPQPSGEYATFQVTTYTTEGTPDEKTTSTPFEGGPDFTGQSRRFWRGTVVVNTFGANAFARAASVKRSVDSPNVHEANRGRGLSLRSSNDLIDVSAFVAVDFEARARVDVFFGFAELETYPTAGVETVAVEEQP